MTELNIYSHVDVQEYMAATHPREDSFEDAMQDLMSFRGVEYVRSELDANMRPAMQKRLMRQRIKEQATADYERFKETPAAMQLRIRPEVYAACTAPKGIITAIVTTVVVNLIARAITNAIIDHWRRNHAST